ncbi:MAG TPA: TolC family protein [Opitutaceae bacterium]|nr:TolC family protein [Opitutaceae bacterium]
MKRILLLLLAGWAAPAGAEVSALLDAPPPLTLEAAIGLALEHNPNLKVDRYNPQIARAEVTAALGLFDPAVHFNRSYDRQYQYPTVSQPLPNELIETSNYGLFLQGTLPTGLTYSVGGSAENERGVFNRFTNNFATFEGVNLTQPLLRGFGFGANLAGVRVARANRAISDWQYRQNLIDIVTNVVDAYSELILAHDRLRIAIRARDLAAELLDENEKRLGAGGMARSDVTTARARVASLEEAVINARYNLLAVENAFRELIGEKSLLPGPPSITVVAPQFPAISVHPAEDYQRALASRPDYQAARLGIVVDRANDAAARNGLLPELNLTASYGYNGLAETFAASRHMAESRSFPSSAIGIDVSLPITNAAGRGAARAARLRLRQSQDDLKRLEADIAVAVANAGAQIGAASQRVQADQAAYQLTNQALQDEEKKLRDGTSSTELVVIAQENLVGVDNSVASALDAQRQAAAAYDRAVGNTLARYHIDPGAN